MFNVDDHARLIINTWHGYVVEHENIAICGPEYFGMHTVYRVWASPRVTVMPYMHTVQI